MGVGPATVGRDERERGQLGADGRCGDADAHADAGRRLRDLAEDLRLDDVPAPGFLERCDIALRHPVEVVLTLDVGVRGVAHAGGDPGLASRRSAAAIASTSPSPPAGTFSATSPGAPRTSRRR